MHRQELGVEPSLIPLLLGHNPTNPIKKPLREQETDSHWGDIFETDFAERADDLGAALRRFFCRE